jgi:hypothetical protein
MNADKIEQLGEDIRQHVFLLLDGEPEIDGMEAGRIAAEVEAQFYRSMLWWDDRVSFEKSQNGIGT